MFPHLAGWVFGPLTLATFLGAVREHRAMGEALDRIDHYTLNRRQP